ncbi:hypothetical protein [Curtobacterium sp. MCSS17_016]|uniref:hypothetical protein n=1 Tax=Curtobacterium sp. MCSS17_016 TaxID=2175644 RepID=UPI000DA7F25A|nr:hypothetical protein [Curtobacterium sp. MCSS17_016]WIE81371.1 hypothetical protein DEJ19_019240 [Curtobacterium sp. MCSS17_016]
MTRIGIPEQAEFQDLTAAEHGAFMEALDAARDVLPATGTIPLEVFIARVRETTGCGEPQARHALHHLQAKHEALYRYGVGVSRSESRRTA